MAKHLTTSIRTEIMEDYKKLLISQSPKGEVDGYKVNFANVVLDILTIYEEKINEE